MADGRDNPTAPGRTTSLTPLGPDRWRRVHKQAGRVVDQSVLTVTPDGRSLLIDTTTAGGLRLPLERQTRVGRGRGLAGLWRGPAVGLNVSPVIVLEDAGGGRLRRTLPNERQTVEAQPGGPAAPYAGPGASPGLSFRLAAPDARTLRWTDLVAGRPFGEGLDRLSADGRRLEETTWPRARPAERQHAVYRR